ncbi:MAG: hypothetical protein HYV14_14595 [Elusimicrobia bacterium]|nr:hypothetical protein [Elusimicrobiota bacterium]
MRKFWSLFMICGALAAAFAYAGTAKAEDKKAPAAEAKVEAKDDAKEAPEFINYDKAKMGAVKFQHKAHADMLGSCDACHGGKEPLFAQKKSDELKMKDMYEGKTCGKCHDGKFKHGDKVVFAAKGSCMKCHKKDKK